MPNKPIQEYKQVKWELLTLDSEEEEGKINLYDAEKVKSFIKSILAKQREEVIKMVEEMKLKPCKELEETNMCGHFHIGDDYYNQALQDIINKLKQ